MEYEMNIRENSNARVQNLEGAFSNYLIEL